jgi:CheY-like chemotaxis protein
MIALGVSACGCSTPAVAAFLRLERCPRQDSNLRPCLRRAVLYPLSYGGSGRARTLPVLPAPARWCTCCVASRPMSSSLGRVLVVDDDDVIRQLISVNLELEGFEVFTAHDGQDCLDKVKDVAPDVVTLDIMMPRLDGWEAAGQLRADPDTAGIKVVLLSARAQEADLERGSRIGVDAYLTKPFDPDELIDVVRRLAGLPSP